MDRRVFLKCVSGAGVVAAVAPRALRASPVAPVPITVYKSPTCGCCHSWIGHIEKNGFKAKVVDMSDVTPIKRDSGVPEKLESCHTALVGAYVVEGHVPADLIHKMLKERPAITGLAVAGMVVGSPGMEQGTSKMPYEVTAFTRDGKTSVYARR